MVLAISSGVTLPPTDDDIHGDDDDDNVNSEVRNSNLRQGWREQPIKLEIGE